MTRKAASYLSMMLAASVGSAGAVAASTPSRNLQTAQQRVEALCRDLQPVVASLAGFEAGVPIPVRLATRDEVRQYAVDVLAREYPDQELQRRSRCLAEIGLLPRGYDLEAGLVAVIDEQAGGLYDPFDKVFLAIADMHSGSGAGTQERLVVAHELAHALQDRVRDLVQTMHGFGDDLDAEYGFRAAMEGTAMVVGMAVAHRVVPDQLGDIGASLRASFAEHNTRYGQLGSSPRYVQQLLLGPYVDGSTLVQAYLADHPDATMADLFVSSPETSEQALHYAKLLERDEPARIVFGAVEDVVPAHWRRFSTLTLGEFEVKMLCLSHDVTRAVAADVGAGWDGLRLAAYDTDGGEPVIVAASAWDSAADAEEFGGAMVSILATIHEHGRFVVEREGARVVFVTGLEPGPLRAAILEALQR